jgi:putative inorganic carbon (hco3(-)) transporter
MTTIALFVYMVCVLGLTLRWPLLGAMTYVWLATSHPQTGNGGVLALAWPAITLTVFFLSYISRSGQSFSLKSSIYVWAFLFWCWTSFTLFFALAPPVAFDLWWNFTRMMIAFFLIGGAISTRRDLNLVVWASLAGVASIIASGLVQVVLSGGGSLVLGVTGSEFSGTNEVARLFGVAGLPYALFFSFHARDPLLRKVCRIGFIACIIAIIGTFSRGAFIALCATFIYWGLISRRRTAFVAQGIILLVIIGALFSTSAKNDFVTRMMTISDYEEDGSFQGRQFAWNFAIETATQRPVVGGGFGVFRLDQNPNNVTGTAPWKDAHSIYFEVLGEHGYVGLVLYLVVVGGTFLKTFTITRRCRGRPELAWERDLAIAARLSLVFHFVGGLTISSTYAQYAFFTLAFVASLEKITRAAVAQARVNAMPLPPTRAGLQPNWARRAARS